jgi:rhomboid family GlyGly-CTERM serine protease
VDAPARLIWPRLPVTTLLLCGAAAAVLALPPLQAALIYSRAAIESGETWRLITGNLVHLSPSHFFFDVVALLVVGTLIETLRYRFFPVLCLASAALIGVTLYAVKPEILVFGGMSGVVTAGVTFLCLHGLREAGAWRWVCLATLICLVIKMSLELAFGWSLLLLTGSESQGFVPVPLSHAVGAATALLVFGATAPPAPRSARAAAPAGSRAK